ncbi:MAG: hypothetical protein ACT4P3_15390 [Betaproteobacteria bacterium]
MRMRARIIRRIAIALIALLGFAQASLSLADCPVERGALALAMAPAGEDGCCGASVSGFDSLYGNRCVAHCTSDLQLAGLAVALVRSPADLPVLLLERRDDRGSPPTGLQAPPPGAPPARILLHSFLI